MGFVNVLRGIGKGLDVVGQLGGIWSGLQHGLVRSQCIGWAEGELMQGQTRLHQMVIRQPGSYGFLVVSQNWTQFDLAVTNGSEVWNATESQTVELVRVTGLALDVERPGLFAMQVSARVGFGEYTVAIRPSPA